LGVFLFAPDVKRKQQALTIYFGNMRAGGFEDVFFSGLCIVFFEPFKFAARAEDSCCIFGLKGEERLECGYPV